MQTETKEFQFIEYIKANINLNKAHLPRRVNGILESFIFNLLMTFEITTRIEFKSSETNLVHFVIPLN